MKKKVLVIGFGVEGKALIKYFTDKNYLVAVADKKSTKELGQNAVIDYQKQGVNFITGHSYLDDLAKYDLLAFSPGLEKSALERVKSSGILWTTQIGIFLRNCPTKNIIGVTGTNGKGTTASLIYEIVKKSGKSAYLAGNIGEEALSLLNVLKDGDWVVLELSSYQLRDVGVSPRIAVVLNITPDHLNIHKDFDDYVSSKANIVRFQTESDFAVLNRDYDVSKNFNRSTPAKIIYFSKEDFVKSNFKLSIPGKHNFENASAAMAVAKLLGVDEKIVGDVFINFKGLKHRLEKVGEVRGVTFIDDSISTTPETAIAAIKSFDNPKIVILGGVSEGADYTKLALELKKEVSVKSLVLIGTTGTNEIPKVLEKVAYKGRVITGFRNLNEAVDKAFTEAGEGDYIILSPASKSFDWFKDYKDRGDQFVRIVKKLAKSI